MKKRQIVALGGYGDNRDQSRALHRQIFHLSGEEKPRVLLVPTAVAESPGWILEFYEAFSPLAHVSHLRFFPWPPKDMRSFVLGHDIIAVAGGNTANMLAVWRVHGFDEILREAWDRGIVLCGASAGMICWFEASVTDSFGPELAPLNDGLGFLPGSACPHYDGEALRRPTYRSLVGATLPPGYAADNGVGLHFVGTELVDVFTCRDGATAYRVSPEGETALSSRLIDA